MIKTKEHISYMISQYEILKQIAIDNQSFFSDMLKEANSYEKKIEIRAKRESNVYWENTINNSLLQLYKELAELYKGV